MTASGWVADFRSDNTAAGCPEILRAISALRSGRFSAYGDDALTASLSEAFGEVVGSPALVVPVVSGTAANALSLALLLPEGGTIYCHEQAHILEAEGGAYRQFRPRSRLAAVGGERGKIDPRLLHRALQEHAGAGVLSLTQLTESGTCYSLDELQALARLAQAAGLRVHMDGARLANAVASLGVPCSRMLAAAGPDAVSFGATKNGAVIADAVVLTSPRRFDREAIKALLRRTGHDVSKAWYVSAQLHAYLTGDLWLRNAQRANAAASALWKRIAAHFDGLQAPDGNELFVPMPEAAQRRLADAGVAFHPWRNTGRIRLVTSWATSARDVDVCARAIAAALAAEAKA